MGYSPGTVYATLAQFAVYGCTPKATETVPPAAITAALQSASDEISAAFNSPNSVTGGSGFGLLDWGADVVEKTCVLAAPTVLRVRGYDPEGKDKAIADAYLAAKRWVAGVAAGVIRPVVTDRANPANNPTGPQVFSYEPRGWFPQDFGRGFNGNGVGNP